MKKIAVIIDSKSIRLSLEKQLEWSGFDVFLFEREKEVKEQIKHVDVLIINPFIPTEYLDNPNFPISLGHEAGVYLIKECQKINPGLDVLVYSSISMEGIIRAGLSELIAKKSMIVPEKFKDILEKITSS